MTNCYRATPLSRDDISKAVHTIRKHAGFENELYFPILHFVEIILPLVIPDFQFEVVPVIELGNKHGETIPTENLIRIREDVYCRASEGEGRDRLTIAHEVGHLFFHENESIALCRLAPDQKLKPYEDPEWQANAFGGELLAPSYLISGMSVDEVSRKCGVSTCAAQVQLKAACQKKQRYSA
ncbi:MAG: ImmA/IrrE family metallo-endopeptidase [Eubacterium sp.]|nr:ImmA/IrrE family metallo-endopeptidase [Eubacterium sp.]